MTVSYKPTQDQDPQEPGSQYSSDGAKRSDNVAGASFSAPTQPGSALGQQGNPAGLPRSIRPNAVVKPPVMPRVLPDQEKRIAASETRVMPNVTLNIARQTRAIPMPSWVEAILLVISLVGVLVAHAYNMFNFPRYE